MVLALLQHCDVTENLNYFQKELGYGKIGGGPSLKSYNIVQGAAYVMEITGN